MDNGRYLTVRELNRTSTLLMHSPSALRNDATLELTACEIVTPRGCAVILTALCRHEGDTISALRLTEHCRCTGGGTAIVYEAVDQLESTRVALKVLHSDETGAPVMPSDAIRREVQYSGRLHHPNICRLLRAFLDEERGLLVMVVCTPPSSFASGETNGQTRSGVIEWDVVCAVRAGGGHGPAGCHQRQRARPFGGEAGAQRVCAAAERGGVHPSERAGAPRPQVRERHARGRHAQDHRLRPGEKHALRQNAAGRHPRLHGARYAGGHTSPSPSAVKLLLTLSVFSSLLLNDGVVGVAHCSCAEMLGGGSVLKDAALGDLGYSPAPIDVWSMGVLLYLCVAGQYPFECKDTPENLTLTLRNVLAGKYHPLPKSLNPQVMDLLGRMLTVNPQQRITLEEIQAHPWLQQREARVGLPPAEFHEAAPGSALSPTADKATAFRLSSRSAQQPLAVAAPASCLEGVFRADAKRSSRDAPMEADAGVTASMFHNHAVPGGAPHEWCMDMEEPGEPTPFTGSLGAMFRSLFSF
jgi:hypothetical protein